MPERTFSSPEYRYGFNGKEKDEEEEWGDLTHYDYGFRIYNPGVGRFLSVDPLTGSYPWYTPYQFAGNMPIWAIDIDGLEPYKVATEDGGTYDNSSIRDEDVPVVTATAIGAISTLPSKDATNVVTQINPVEVQVQEQSSRSQDSDNFWKVSYDSEFIPYNHSYVRGPGKPGSYKLYLTTEELFARGRYDFPLQAGLLREKFDTEINYSQSFMGHLVLKGQGDFNDHFALVLMATPIGGGLGGLVSRFGSLGKFAFSRVGFKNFYTVQSPKDVLRLINGGNPWPVSPSRAHLGPGLYAWSELGVAQAYRSALVSQGATEVRIVTLRISRLHLHRMKTINLYGKGPEFLGRHSKIFGEGLPHGFDRIIRGTNFGAENYFNKDVFNRFFIGN